jgi:hypothetical protein
MRRFSSDQPEAARCAVPVVFFEVGARAVGAAFWGDVRENGRRIYTCGPWRSRADAEAGARDWIREPRKRRMT